MERASGKHNVHLDDQMKHETEGLVRAGHQTRGEEWKESEPAGEDQPDVDEVPYGAREGGTPPGMTEVDVEARSELAQYVGTAPFPANRGQLVQTAQDQDAPDRWITVLEDLPNDHEFHNTQEVAEILGYGVEGKRF